LNGAVPQGAGLLRQYRHVMPRIVDCLFPAEVAAVFGNNNPVLAYNNPVGISLDFDGTPDRARLDRVFVIVEANQAGLRH